MSDTEHNENNGVETPSMTGTSGDGGATDAHLTARCKWFNNKAGYGFVTVSGSKHDGTDVFVHHTGISVSSEQYRYLVQGEYVEINMDEMVEGDHKWQANNVRGINGGWLMCETRNDARETRTAGDEDGEDHGAHRQTSGRRGGAHGGERGGRGGGERGGGPGGAGGRSAKVQRYRVRGPGPREGGGGSGGGGGNEVWELVRTTRNEGGTSDGVGSGGHGHNRD